MGLCRERKVENREKQRKKERYKGISNLGHKADVEQLQKLISMKSLFALLLGVPKAPDTLLPE